MMEFEAAKVCRANGMQYILDSKKIGGGWAFLGEDTNLCIMITEVYGYTEVYTYRSSPEMVQLRWVNT